MRLSTFLALGGFDAQTYRRLSFSLGTLFFITRGGARVQADGALHTPSGAPEPLASARAEHPAHPDA
jgi:hypothetical protein